MFVKYIDGWYFCSNNSDPELNSTSIHQGFLYGSRRSFQSYYYPSHVVSALIPLEVNTVYTLSIYADEYSWEPASRPSIVLWQSDTIDDTRMPHDIWASPLVPDDPAYVVNSWPGETVYNLTNLPAWSGEWDYLNFRPRRYAVTFTTPAAMFNHRRIQLMFYDTRTSSTSRTLCTKIQLEKGSEATEWSLNNDELAIGGVQISKTGLNLTDTSLNIFSGTTRIGGLSKPADGKSNLDLTGALSVATLKTKEIRISESIDHDYLQLLNAYAAGGLKVGGLLVSDSYVYADPGRNDAVIKGNLTVGSMPFVGTAPIIQSGSNANGSWIKYADGTMVCHGMSTVTAATNIAMTGGGYRTSGFLRYLPSSFINASYSIFASNATGPLTISFFANPHTESTFTFGACTISVDNTARDRIGYYFAIGRWR